MDKRVTPGMDNQESTTFISYVAILFFLIFVGVFYITGAPLKVLGISIFSFTAMMGATAIAVFFSRRHTNLHSLTWGYGLASGAMLASASVFLLPNAMLPAPAYGGFGVAGGVVAGFMLHTLGHQIQHETERFDDTIVSITTHAVLAGVVIGAIYALLPSLGIVLGLAIVSHKGPAGYSIAQRRIRKGKTTAALAFPSIGVGLTALPVSLISFSLPPMYQAIVFGFATGIFIHVSLDFLPKCEVGSELHTVAQKTNHNTHELLDSLRWQAAASTFSGFLLVLILWSIVA